MHRFFIPNHMIYQTGVVFPDKVAHQMQHVLRFQAGDVVMVLDNQGRQFQIALEDCAARPLSGSIIKMENATGEPKTRLDLYISLTQREKFEWILQKCTEVGVSAFFPFTSSRSLVPARRNLAIKADRWEKIIQEAAEQSRRGRIPDLHGVETFSGQLSRLPGDYDACLLAWEGAEGIDRLTIDPHRGKVSKVAMIIGPEGGFSEDEVNLARAHGIGIVSLGERILRMETAAVVAATLVLHSLGDL